MHQKEEGAGPPNAGFFLPVKKLNLIWLAALAIGLSADAGIVMLSKGTTSVEPGGDPDPGGGGGQPESLIVWDDWETWRDNNTGDLKVFRVYNGSPGDAGPNQQDVGVVNGMFRSTTAQDDVYYTHHFSAACTQPNRWWRGHIKYGTFDMEAPPTRMTFGLVSTTGGPSAAPSDNFNVGTYLKAIDNFDPSTNTGGCEDNNNHFYHGVGFPRTANVPIKFVLTTRPDHQRGGSTSQNFTPISDYFTRLTRFYIQDWGVYNANPTPAATWDLYPIYAWRQEEIAEEDDVHIGISASQYDGTRYVVSFAGRAWEDDVFDVRYTLDGTSLHDIGFESGIDGGTVSTPGDAYTTVTWTLTTPESPNGLHVAFRLKGETLFREIYHPYQYSASSLPFPE